MKCQQELRTQTLELIPDKTAVRAIINFTGGDAEKSDFGHGKLFKNSSYHKRKVWADMEVHHYWRGF